MTPQVRGWLVLALVLGTVGLGLGAAAGVGAADWPMFGANLENTGHLDTPAPTGNITVAWNVTRGTISAQASVVNGTVYVGTGDHNVYAFNATTGTEQWQFATGGSVGSTPTVENNTVYVGSNDGNVYALNVSTGMERWNYSTGDLVRTSPAVVNGSVFVGSNDGNVYSLDAATGTEHWIYSTGGKVQSSPAVSSGRVFVGSSNDTVHALNATTGTEQWQVTTGFDVDSSPAVADGTVYVGSRDYKLYALDTATGAEQWNYSTNAQLDTAPAVNHSTVYVTSGNNIYAIDAATGTQDWRVIQSNVVSSPSVANNTVYVGNGDGNVYGFNASSGTERWNFSTGQFVSAAPAITDGTVYIGSNDLYALTDGTPTDTTGSADFSVSITGTNSPVNVTETLTVTATIENTGDHAGTQTVTLTTNDTQRDSTSISLASGESTSTTFSWATQVDDAGAYTAEVSSADDTATTAVSVGDEVLLDGGTYYVGQVLVTEAFASTDDVVLETGEGVFITDVPINEHGVVALSTRSRSAGNYILTNGEGTSLAFDLVEQSLSMTGSPETVANAGTETTVEFSGTSNRADYSLVVSSSQLTGDELASVLNTGTGFDADDDGTTDSVRLDASTSFSLSGDFTDLAPGDYTLEFNVPDTTARESVTITVESPTTTDDDEEDDEDPTGTATFSVPTKVVSEHRGDIAAIPITFTETDHATLTLGSTNLHYKIRLDITDGDGDDTATLRWNTDRARQATDVTEVFSTAGSADSITDIQRVNAPLFSDPQRRIAAEAYPMSLSVDRKETDVGTVSLQDPNTLARSLTLERARSGPAPKDVPDMASSPPANTIAHGDYLVLRLRAAGIHGYIHSTTDLATGTDGVNLTIQETSLFSNEQPDTISPTTFTFFHTPQSEEIVLVAKTSHPDFETGETYRATYAINPSANPYVDEPVEKIRDFSIAARQAQITAPVSGGEIRVQQVVNQSISGTTNLANGTTVNLTVQSSGTNVPTGQPFLQSHHLQVDSGRFAASFDFSAVPQGQAIIVTVQESGTELESRSGVVTRSASVSMSSQISASGQVIVVDSAFVPNAGYVGIYNDQVLQSGDLVQNARGASKFLPPGQHEDIQITLDTPLNMTRQVVAIAHIDTDQDSLFDFVSSNGNTDTPYTRNGQPVSDSATIQIPTPTPPPTPMITTPTPSPTPTPTPMTTTPTPTPTSTPTPVPTTTTPGDGEPTQPGFGFLPVLVSLIVFIALLATRRN